MLLPSNPALLSGGMISVLAPLRALVVALIGVFIAWAWFKGGWWAFAAGCVAVVAFFAGYVSDVLGKSRLPKHPKSAIEFMEWWILSPLVLAAVGAAVVIVVAVWLTAPEGTPAQTKELLGALGTGITAFITAAVVSWTSKDDSSVLADHIQEIFETVYKGRFGAYPEARNAVYSDIQGIKGWGRESRRRRAQVIANTIDDHPELAAERPSNV